MKRAWLVMFMVVFAIVIGGGWWLLRDTPEKVLEDGLSRLFAAESIGALRLDVSWTDPEKRVTVGWTALGQADTSNLAEPGFFGVIFLGAGVLDREQTFDAVLRGQAVALRPTDASESTWRIYDNAVNDPARKTFAVIDRNVMLDQYGLGSLRPKGSASIARSMLPTLAPAIVISGPLQMTTTADRTYATVPFTLDRSSLEPFLVAVARAWKGTALTAAEIQSLQRYATDLSRGTYRLTIDQGTRQPALIDASWPQLDAQMRVQKRITVHAEIFALNATTEIAIPLQRKDATLAVFQLPSERLGTAEARPSYVAPTGTESTASAGRSVSDEERFSRYLDELQRRRRSY